MWCLLCPKCNSILSSVEEGWSCPHCETSFDHYMKELESYSPAEIAQGITETATSTEFCHG